VLRYPVDLLRSAFIGTVVGLLPGIGAAIGATVSYSMARLTSREPAKFGTGAPEGIISSEGAASATVSAALVPMISLGIPGSTADVFLLAALMIHAIQPGPLLVVERPDIFFGIIGAALMAVLFMLPIVLLASASLANVLRVPRHLLTVAVIAFCIVGTYTSAKSVSELWTLLAFSLVGLVMILNHLPLPAFVIGFILGPMAEGALRTGLMSSRGSLLPLIQRPLPLVLLLAAAAMVVWVVWRSRSHAATEG
jgi:putative tricarboxylic transport membrane protein